MRRLALVLMVVGLCAGVVAMPAHASEGRIYVVRSGDTLVRIADRHNLRASELARVDGLQWDAWVYVGRRLTIPGSTTSRSTRKQTSTYLVRRGDTVTKIAARHGVTVNELAQASGLPCYAWVYVGQRLTLPGGAGTMVPRRGTDEGWIDVNLTTQTLTAYEGSRPVYSAPVSTGLSHTPTLVARFHIWAKLPYDDMEGPGYYLPDVPHVMYFHRGYGVHGTYWHGNFGTPMSHGCVNLSTADARWIIDWASVGPTVVTHL